MNTDDYKAQMNEMRERLAAASREPGAVIAEPYPAIEYIPPRILNAADRRQLHKLALKLIDRADDMIIDHGRTPEGLTAAAAALTAATTALLACSTNDAKGGT